MDGKEGGAGGVAVQRDGYEEGARCWYTSLKGVGTGIRWVRKIRTTITEDWHTWHQTQGLVVRKRDQQPGGREKCQPSSLYLGQKVIREYN